MSEKFDGLVRFLAKSFLISWFKFEWSWLLDYYIQEQKTQQVKHH